MDKTHNYNMLEEVVQNSEQGKNTLAQILPMTQPGAFQSEALAQQKEYRRINQKAHTAMAAMGWQAKGQSTRAKLTTEMGIAMKTMADRSERNLAEMLAQGSEKGVLDCRKAETDFPAASDGAKQLCQELRTFEQTAQQRWEEFL